MISKKIKVLLAACAALILTAGLASAAAPVCPVGHICVTATERENQKIVLVDLTPPGSVQDIFSPTQLPDSLLLDTSRRYIYDETVNNQVRRFDPATSTDVLLAGAAQGIVAPFDMILDPTGQFLYVSNYFDGLGGGNRITITDLNAALPNATTCPTPVTAPQGLAFDSAGNLFVLAQNTPASPGVSGIYRINKTTCAVLQSNINFDPTNSLDGLTYDPSTNRLFATSNKGNSVYSIDPVTLAAVNIANGTVPTPDGIINDSHGTLYVAARTGFVYSVNEATGAATQLTPVPTIDDLGIVPAQAPLGGKTFTPPSVLPGGISTLTITITNSNPATPLIGLNFIDNFLPLAPGLVVSATPNATNTCGGTFAPVAGATSLTLTGGGPLAGGASCTVTVSVTDNNVGGTISTNCVTVNSQNGGPGPQACATLTINASPAMPPTISKTFAPAQVTVNGTSVLTVQITNPNNAGVAPVNFTNVNFTDPLPAGVTVASPALTNTCGGIITFAPGVAPFTSFTLTGGAIPQNTTCTMTFTVTGVTAGVKNNVIATVTATDPGANVVTGGPATATLVVVGPPSIAKTFNPASIVIGTTATLTFLITNPNPTVALTGVSFTDTLPGIIQVSGTQASPFPACGGTVTATPLGNSVSLAGATLAANGNCTFSISVTGLTVGNGINVTSTVTSNEGGPGTPATAPVAVIPPPTPALDPYQIRYAANLDKGDSFLNFTNAGTLNGADPAGRICVNVYTFDPAEEMISCCSCLVTPNGINSLSAQQDLISNTLTAGKPTSIVIKLLASTPNAGTCNASSPNAANLVRGMRAWGTTLHALPTIPQSFGTTETPFSPVELSPSELAKLTSFCGFIQTNGSGFGICASCRVGALGGSTK